MAEIVRYLDPDATGAGNGTSWTDAYTTMSAWNTGEATNLVTDGDNHVLFCRNSAGSSIAGFNVLSTDWTTSSTNNILLIAADGYQAVKSSYDTSRFRVEGNSTAPLIEITGVNVDITGLQVYNADVGSGGGAITYTSGAAGTISKCRLRQTSSSNFLLRIADTVELNVINSILYDDGTQEAASEGIYCMTSFVGTLNIYNLIVTNFNDGIEEDGTAAPTVTNCAVWNNTDDFDGTFTISNCASDDGDGANAVSPSGLNWGNEFTDIASGDFTLLDTGNLYQAGTDLSGIFTDDIDGDTRSNWDIGPDEYQASTASIIPQVAHHYRANSR